MKQTTAPTLSEQLVTDLESPLAGAPESPDPRKPVPGVFVFALATLAALVACGDDPAPADSPDHGADLRTGDDAGPEVDLEAGGDAGPEVDLEAGGDAGPEVDLGPADDASIDADGRGETGPDGLPLCDTTAASDTLLVEGDYLMALSIEPLGGLVVLFRTRVVASDTEILEFEVWSRSPDQTWESPTPIGRFCDQPVDAEGNFEVAFDVMTIPGEGNTTGVSVDVTNGVFGGRLLDSTTFCGTAAGDVPLLGLNIAGSTFRGVPLGEETSPPEAACQTVAARTYDPIDECPVLVDGPNDMRSAELDRDLLLILPEDVIGDDRFPVVFLFHGGGGRAEDVLDYSGLEAVARLERFILVVPNGARTAGGDQVFPVVDWNSLAAQFDNDNQDLVFFDDIILCLREQLLIDDNRIYVTGMSGGGLWSSYIGLHRSQVVAAAAPFSGGYLLAFQEPARPVPYMLSWGGEGDIAVGTNFDETATELIDNLTEAGHFVVACDHGEGHSWPPEMTPAIWPFLSAFTLGDTANPFGDALPDAFPDYCAVR